MADNGLSRQSVLIRQCWSTEPKECCGAESEGGSLQHTHTPHALACNTWICFDPQLYHALEILNFLRESSVFCDESFCSLLSIGNIRSAQSSCARSCFLATPWGHGRPCVSAHGCQHPNACFSELSKACPKFLTWDFKILGIRKREGGETYRAEKKQAYTTTIGKKIFWRTFLAGKKNFPGRWWIQKPYKNQENHIHHRNLSSVDPIFFCKEKFCTGAGRLYAFFFPVVRFGGGGNVL